MPVCCHLSRTSLIFKLQESGDDARRGFNYLQLGILKVEFNNNKLTNMRDDQEFNIKFVTLLETYPCLYDNTREDYHMSHVQERAWAKIANDIGEGANIADCKKRWKNLRGSYTKHLKIYMPSGSGASVKRPYYLSEYISFVLPFTKSRQSKGNVEAPSNNEPSDTLGEETFTEDLHTEELETEQLKRTKNNQPSKNDTDDEQSGEANQDVSDVILSQHNSLNLKQRKQRKRSSSSSVLSENQSKKKITQKQVTLGDVNKSAFEYFEKMKEAPYKPSDATSDDADRQFLLSLLPDLKKMTDKQKRKYKIGILNLTDKILDEPVVTTYTSIPLFSPTTSDSYSSHFSARSRPASTTAPSCQADDSQLSYQDISFASAPPEHTLLPIFSLNQDDV